MTRALTRTALAAVAAAGLGFWTGLPGTSGPFAMIGAAEAADASEIVEMSLGNPDATVEVIEYASFTCGHCANFNQTVMKDLKRDYIDTGKIHFIHRDVYFDRYGLWASMVARCGGEMRYFGISDMLFEELGEWTQGQPAEIGDNLRKIGRKAGLSDEQVNACLQDADKAQALVDWYEANRKEHGIDSTPSFIINGQKYSNMSYDEFAEILDEKLGE